MHRGSRFRKRMGHVALFVALAVVPVLALNSLATADTGGRSRLGLTDAQRQCLAEQGVTLPAGGDDSARPKLDHEQRKELHAASVACDLRGPKTRIWFRRLTAEERQCLADQGFTRAGARGDPGARAALRQAAQDCGVPTRGSHGDRGTI